MNIKLKLVKLLDIFILGNIYMFLGCLISSYFKKYICKPYDRKKSKFMNFLQLIIEIGLIMITVYFIRNFVKYQIPNPLNNLYGFDSNRVKELGGGIVLAFAFLLYMKDSIKSKIDELYNWFE